MKSFTRFLLLALCLAPCGAGADTVTPVGSNLTQYNSGMGAINNNNWNNLMNSRSGGTAATADFGNCNAVILRCAQPKCTGCTSLELARPIVSGCVQSNANCKQYGDDLIEYISAQLVANSTARANEQALSAQAAAAQSAAAQSAQQLQQMQAQMQQMQAEMAAQNAQQMQQMQAALEEQKQLTAQAIADASAASATPAASAATVNTTNNNMVASPSGENQVTAAQMAAAQAGVSADLLAREQISGQILSKIENAEVAMKTLKAAMDKTFEYAGCDKTGNNCAGPKRVKAFKNYAMDFFEPYNDVLDELYDALITAQAVGVDITDIYMMLEGSCNVWGEYLCSDTTNYYYGNERTESGRGSGDSFKETSSTGWNNCVNGKSTRSPTTKGGHECYVGQVIPAEDSPACTLHRTLSDQSLVYRNWLYAEEGENDAMIRVGCASAALETSTFFRNRKKQASIDIDTLQRIIEQDAPQTYGSSRWGTSTDPLKDGIKYCAVNPKTLQELQKVVTLKKLPDKVCVKEDDLGKELDRNGAGVSVADASSSNKSEETSGGISVLDCSNSMWKDSNECKCRNSGGTWWGGCSCPQFYELTNHECQFRFSSSAKLTVPDLNVTTLSSNSAFTNVSSNTKNLLEDNCNSRNGTWRDGKCMCGDKIMTLGKCVFQISNGGYNIIM